MMQESDEYKNMIRQHLDLKVIETKLQKGSYSSCTLAFYRDLLLLFTNATIFFPKSSLESIAAHELRQLVLKESKKNTRAPRPDPSPEPSDSLPPTSPSHTKRPELETPDLPKIKPNAPIIVCRKRSSISSKPSSSSLSQKEEQQSDEKKPVLDLKAPVINPKEKKPVTGTRSSRRSKEINVTNSSDAPTKKQTSTSTGKMEKKKPEALAIEKKRSAADFLKRIKRNSRGEGSGGEQKGKDSGKSEKEKEKDKERVLRPNSDRKAAQKEKSSPSKRSVGRPPKKAAETTNAVSAKRSREGGGKETSKRPRKRSRR